MTNAALGKARGRTKGAIAARLSLMGIKRAKKGPEKSEAENMAVTVRQKVTDEIMAIIAHTGLTRPVTASGTLNCAASRLQS